MINIIDNTNIKNIITDTIPNLHPDKIILFGSRARNDFVAESDYDLLIILNDHISQQDKREASSLIRKAFAKKLIDVDIIIKAKNEINYYRDKIGSIVKNALEEGILI